MSEPKKTVIGWIPPQNQPQPQLPEYLQPYQAPPQQPQVPVAAPYSQTYIQPPQQPYPQQPQQPYPQQPTYPQQQAYPQQPYPQQGQWSPLQQPLPLQPPSPTPTPTHQQSQASARLPAQKAGASKQKAAYPDHPGSRKIPNADATSGVSERVRFIRRTYVHLFASILAFSGLLYLLMTNAFLGQKVSTPLVTFALGVRWHWGVVLAVFMVVSWIADYWASHTTSRAVQYLGLAFYIVAEALIFVPLLAIVAAKTQVILARGGAEPHIIRDSAFVTLGVFTALTLSVFLSKKDFSFLRSGLVMASGAALMLIVLSLTFGFNLGLAFSIGMVLLAAGYILYQTSQILAHYHPGQHVAAALALFSSVALMFWYVIRIFLRARS